MIRIQHNSLSHDVPFSIIINHGEARTTVVLESWCTVDPLCLFDTFLHSALDLLMILQQFCSVLFISSEEKALHAVFCVSWWDELGRNFLRHIRSRCAVVPDVVVQIEE